MLWMPCAFWRILKNGSAVFVVSVALEMDATVSADFGAAVFSVFCYYGEDSALNGQRAFASRQCQTRTARV